MKKLLFALLLFPILVDAQDGILKTLVAGGVADAYMISESLPSNYDQKERFQVIFPFNNTGTATLKRAGLLVKTIKKNDGTNLSANDIVAGSVYLIAYNYSTGFYQCRICGGSSGSGTVSSVASADVSIGITNPTTTVDLSVLKAPIWSTARLLAGNSVNGSSNVAFANKFIVQGTSDSGLSGAQFLGALGSGIVKNATTTGVLSIASAGTDYEVPLTFSTGLTRSTNTITVNTSQNISTLSNLTSNGFVTTSGGTGVLSITTPGTGISTWIVTPSWTNFNSAITGTAPFWSLSTGGTRTGVNTLSGTTPSGLIFTDSWTATANNQFAINSTGSFITRNTNNDTFTAYLDNPAIAVNAGNPTGQTLYGRRIDPIFSGASSTKYALGLTNNLEIKTGSAVAEAVFINSSTTNYTLGLNGATSFIIQNINTGYGMTLNNTLFDFNSSGVISWRSQANVSNQFLLGDQTTSPTTARIGATIVGMTQSGTTAYTPTTGAAELLRIGGSNGLANFQSTSGSATYTVVHIKDVINQTSTASGAITVLNVDATLTSITGQLYGLVVPLTTSFNGFGTATPTQMLDVRGNLILGTAGNKFFVTEGSNGSVGQTTLVSGTKAVTVTGTTTSSRCFATLVSQGGTVTTTVSYGCVCTSNTVTITALTNALGTDATDTSIVNYWIVN